jgi:hypothetical protein
MDVKDESQILRDIFRTFPEIPYFTKEGEGCTVLQ